MADATMRQTPPSSASAGGNAEQAQQYLTFILGKEVYGIGILGIKEIIEYGNITEVPMMPAYVRGVINLRGVVVPVADLLVRFGKQPCAVTKRACIVITEIVSNGVRHDMGIAVDAVNAVLEIPACDVQPPPEFGSTIRTDFIHGMGKVDGKFVILLNVDRVLTAAELTDVSQVAPSELSTVEVAAVA